MRVQQIMTTNVACCTEATTLNQVARLMVEHDCGEIPVTDSSGKLLGVVTDRDICCRAVAQDCNVCDVTAGAVMSTPVITAKSDMEYDECLRLMEQNMIRRIPVVDDVGFCIGIVSQADIANKGSEEIAEVVKYISQPTHSASNTSVR